ncbi:hypothetical protein [Rhodothermus marinus]|uniref:hypothetical protein n=1 Tax=Rhodothermus marinus TaxID=29549 RepID=UPI0018C8D414|nr:hypothetical protein [Rhodothermus marinus]
MTQAIFISQWRARFIDPAINTAAQVLYEAAVDQWIDLIDDAIRIDLNFGLLSVQRKTTKT